MNNKTIIIIALLIGVFTFFTAVVNAKCNFLCSTKPSITVTLKDNADIDKSKVKISKIKNTRIVKITDRNKEWSKMVNKMDLPKMENPFKNEFILKTNKNADITEICNQIKSMDFVEKVEYSSDTKQPQK